MAKATPKPNPKDKVIHTGESMMVAKRIPIDKKAFTFLRIWLSAVMWYHFGYDGSTSVSFKL